MTRVALHACCGPCLLEPFDELSCEHEVTIVYANPNIHPIAEYRRRRDVLVMYADARGCEVVEVPYEPVQWLRATAGLETDQPARCRACWRLRLGLTADIAAQRGIGAIATTLTVSPHQDAEALAEVAARVAAERGLRYVGRNFRDRYSEASRRSKELGMYRQNYCGCLLSEIEAEQDRARRREARRSAAL